MFNLARTLDRNAERSPDTDAVIFGTDRFTHKALHARVNALASALGESGIGRGDVIAILMSNCPEFLETAFAANRIGAAFLPLNVRLAAPELEYILEHSSARVVVTETQYAAIISGIQRKLGPAWTVLVLGTPEDGQIDFREFAHSNRGEVIPAVDVAESDLHRLMYTSGTTSRPKGVPITFGNFYWKSIAHVAEFGLTARDRTAMVGPMYHVGAFDLPGIGTWWVGGSLQILPRFDVVELLTAIAAERPSNIWLAPAMVNAILREPTLADFDTSSIRFLIGGGEKMPVPLIERLLKAFPNGRFADAYGLTETVSGDTFLDEEHILTKLGSVGRPVLNLDVKVVDDDGSAVEANFSGEILLRGPKVVTQYWKDPEATAAAFTADGWFHTGDVGHLDDDGYLFIDDRKKDMIVSGGENVSASEVERVLYEHNGVFEAAVVALPDERWGEVPQAFVVRKPDSTVTGDEIIVFCRQHLAAFKSPKRVTFLEALPRNPSGKVLKRVLRETSTAPTESSADLSNDDLLEAYRRMALIREFESRVSVLYRNSEIPGFVHLSIGQEATAVGACWPLGPHDVITSNHRGHGHVLAKGLDPESMMAELFGRGSGANQGLGGSMHIADPSKGIFGANGIVAAGIPIAAGAALASRIRTDRSVTVAFFGDGAVAQGAFHEAVNLAALWKLPVVFFCENNGYAEFSPASDQHPVDLKTRASGYGMAFHAVDGNDIQAVIEVMSTAVATARAGGGPVFVEASTYRWHGHYEGDPERYRSEAERLEWEGRDPVASARAELLRRGVGETDLATVDSAIVKRIEDAIAAARAAAPPSPSVTSSALRAPAAASTPVLWTPDADSEVFRTMDAIRTALEYELESDESVFIAGIDVGKGGNVFGLTRGLYDRWPNRLLDTPISETAVMGLGVGAAMAGMRPVVELMYLDFLGVCFDQICNQAAKMRFMTGGNATVPLTVRTQFGAGRSSGAQHSQSLEVLFAHIPGLTVVMPSTPADTYGLLRAAIRDPNPVIFIENRHLYGMKGPKPPADYTVPLGKAAIVRPGTDITVVSFSRMVHESLAAAEVLAGNGIEAEVIDLRTVAPLDTQTILESLARTGALVVAHEAVTDFGVGAEIAAVAASEGFRDLDGPIVRVAPPRTPVPYAPNLEASWLPDRSDIVRAVEKLMTG